MTVVAKHEGNLEGWSGTASQAVVTAEEDLQPKPNTQALLGRQAGTISVCII